MVRERLPAEARDARVAERERPVARDVRDVRREADALRVEDLEARAVVRLDEDLPRALVDFDDLRAATAALRLPSVRAAPDFLQLVSGFHVSVPRRLAASLASCCVGMLCVSMGVRGKEIKAGCSRFLP